MLIISKLTKGAQKLQSLCFIDRYQINSLFFPEFQWDTQRSRSSKPMDILINTPITPVTVQIRVDTFHVEPLISKSCRTVLI